MFATAATTPVHKHFVFNDILSKRFCSDFVLCVFFTVWLYFSFISHFCYYFFAIIFLGEKMGTLMNWKKKKNWIAAKTKFLIRYRWLLDNLVQTQCAFILMLSLLHMLTFCFVLFHRWAIFFLRCTVLCYARSPFTQTK